MELCPTWGPANVQGFQLSAGEEESLCVAMTLPQLVTVGSQHHGLTAAVYTGQRHWSEYENIASHVIGLLQVLRGTW